MSAHWVIFDYDLDIFSRCNERIATDEDTDEMYCSECGEPALLNRYEEHVPSKFCPHCGKEMYVPIKCEELLKSLNIGGE